MQVLNVAHGWFFIASSSSPSLPLLQCSLFRSYIHKVTHLGGLVVLTPIHPSPPEGLCLSPESHNIPNLYSSFQIHILLFPPLRCHWVALLRVFIFLLASLITSLDYIYLCSFPSLHTCTPVILFMFVISVLTLPLAHGSPITVY